MKGRRAATVLEVPKIFLQIFGIDGMLLSAKWRDFLRHG
jgi:hypothetical protein